MVNVIYIIKKVWKKFQPETILSDFTHQL